MPPQRKVLHLTDPKEEDPFVKIRRSQLTKLLSSIQFFQQHILNECTGHMVRTRDIYPEARHLECFQGCGIEKKEKVKKDEDRYNRSDYQQLEKSHFKLIGQDPKDPSKTIVLAESEWIRKMYFGSDGEEEEGEEYEDEEFASGDDYNSGQDDE